MGLNKDSIAGTKSTKATIGSLYEEYYDRIVRYIFVRINDQNEAENLGGDVFLRALQSLDSYRGDREQVRAWLFKIAYNVVVDYLRKTSKRKTVSLEEMEIPERLNIEEAVETKLEVERLSKALKQLTPAQRQVIGLRFFAGLSSTEVGKILGKSGGAVREMQRAAVETLRNQMYV
ncbi:MAG: sigma-70 family RNA polymerase sigma factor [Dehalococcoidales bacterium]